MSKLTEYQIRAMIDGLEMRLARGERRLNPSAIRRTRERLAMYRAELDERTKTVQVGRTSSNNNLSLQQTNPEKPPHSAVSERAMEQKKDALAIAGDQVAADQQEAVDVAMWIGRQQAFGMIGNKCSAAQASILKRLKDTSAHKAFGLSREEFCDKMIGISRQTADRIVANLEEFGAQYFAMSNVMRISPTTYRLLAGTVTETNELVIGDEKIPITKANAERIVEAVGAIRKEAEQAKQQVYDAKSDLKKARSERDNAKTAADKARQELLEFKRRADEMFPGADADHKVMLKVQSDVDFGLLQLANLGRKENLAPENQARLVGLCEYIFRALVQISHEIRELYGVGWNEANPADLLEAEQNHANARNLLNEFVDKTKRGK